jgi:hypothetical protein
LTGQRIEADLRHADVQRGTPSGPDDAASVMIR